MKISRGLLLLVLLAWVLTQARGEVLMPDSIQNILNQTPKDSAYIVRLNNLAFGFLKSNPEIGRSLAEKSAGFARAINYGKGTGRALNVIGSSYWVVGNYELALNYYHLSAEEAENSNDDYGLSLAYHNMGEVYKKLGDYSKAISFLRSSISWSKGQKAYFGLAIYNIGEAHYLLGRYDSAQNYFDRSLSIALKDNDGRTIAYAYTGLGKIKRKHKDYYQALAYFTKAEKLWKEQGEIRALIQTYQDFAETFVALNQTSRAMDYINMAIILADEISAPDLQIANYRQQSNLYVQQGDLSKALGSMNLHVMIKDSLFHEKRRQEIARLQAQFESGAREVENQQLKATQALQQAQIRTQRLMLISLTGALAAAAIMALILFRQRKKVAQVNALLREKTMEIELQKEEIVNQTAELKDLNDQLQDLNRSLEFKIEERTQRLTWQNQKLAEYAHANAHQLRAPVVSILGLLNLVEKSTLNDGDKVLVDKLQICGKDLDRITRVISKNLEDDEILK